MSFRTPRPLGQLVLLGLLASGCAESPTQVTTPIAAGTDPVTALEQLAVEANSRGESDRASDFTAGILAIRLGVRPTEIAVAVDGEVRRYLAVVTATTETLANGETELRRALVAWTNTDHPEAILQVTTLGPNGEFSSAAEPASDPRGRAFGTWSDLVRRARYIATTGSAMIAVQSVGEECSAGAERDNNIRCSLALFELNVDGLFRLNGERPDAQLPAVRIFTSARDVNGVIVTRNGPSGGGTTVRPSRPVPTQPRPAGR